MNIDLKQWLEQHMLVVVVGFIRNSYICHVQISITKLKMAIDLHFYNFKKSTDNNLYSVYQLTYMSIIPIKSRPHNTAGSVSRVP